MDSSVFLSHAAVHARLRGHVEIQILTEYHYNITSPEHEVSQRIAFSDRCAGYNVVLKIDGRYLTHAGFLCLLRIIVMPDNYYSIILWFIQVITVLQCCFKSYNGITIRNVLKGTVNSVIFIVYRGIYSIFR